MSKDGGGDTQNTIRYAPYIERVHSELLDHGGEDTPALSFVDSFNATINMSPYGAYAAVEPDRGFFGVRTDDPNLLYEIGNFPSLWDVFGKFMGGLDVHDLWAQVYEDVVQGPEIENAIVAQSAIVQDDIDANLMPKFLAGMRDIMAVYSTAFVIGRAIISTAHVRQINKFSSAIRLHAMNIGTDIWKKHLDWDNMVTDIYSRIFKLYYSARLDIDRVNLEYEAKDYMWNINLFENARGIIGAPGGGAAGAGVNEPSQTQKAIAGAMTGAAAGWMLSAGNPAGAVIGGLIGLAASFL